MCVALGTQPFDVFTRFDEVGFARDVLLHHGVEGLNADFKLQSPSGKLRDGGFEHIGQMVGHDFKMHKCLCIRVIGLGVDFF